MFPAFFFYFFFQPITSRFYIESHAPETLLIVLPPDDVGMVKASELNDLNDLNRSSKHLWTCAHCTVHCGDLKSREIVVEHLKSTYVSIPVLSLVTTYLSYLSRHEINSPREPEDLLHESTITMVSRRATRLNLRAVWRPSVACNSLTEGSCHDAVVGFAVRGHYVSYYPFLSQI